MDCPLCSDSQMITLELDCVEVDFCLQCKGIWLDAGELEMLLGQASRAEEMLNSFRPADIKDESPRKCPICLKKMQKIDISNADEPLIIDKCGHNHGLWFDKGELPSILSCAKLDPQDRIMKLLSDIFEQ